MSVKGECWNHLEKLFEILAVIQYIINLLLLSCDSNALIYILTHVCVVNRKAYLEISHNALCQKKI